MASDQEASINDEKIDNLLDLSVNIPKEDLEKAQELSIGYDEMETTWELIVRYTGDDTSVFERYVEDSPVFLIGNYAVVKIKESRISDFSQEPQIIFIEKPKRLFPNIYEGIYSSCINETQNELGLYGEGVIVGVVDSGIDYTHPVFRNADGTTRILSIWDQTIDSDRGYYGVGTIYTEQDINEALKSDDPYSIVKTRDPSGHGTHVTGIAAGNFADNPVNNIGIATKSSLIVVKLKSSVGSFYPGTVQLIEGIDYIVRNALELERPLALNISYGNNYGSHNGAALVETYIDNIATLGEIGIAIGTGNEGYGAGHSLVQIENGQTKEAELTVSNYEKNLNVQIWKLYVDDIAIEIESPGGQKYVLNDFVKQQEYIFETEQTKMLIISGEPKPYNEAQEVYIELIPIDMYISKGIWKFILTGRNIVDGRIDLYLQTSGAIGSGTQFLVPSPITTLTIPSTASKAVSVGAYDSRTGAYANFSGRGYTRVDNQVKPDIVAPGVNIVSALPGGGKGPLSGTSMATPFVTGSMALLMEWGIVRGNDRYMYGDKLKAYLKKNAKRDARSQYPNEKEGWGKLCVGKPE